MEIYHNPRCRKSRETLGILQENGVEPQIRLYLDKPLDKKELKGILSKLNMSASALIRKSEAVFKEQFKGKVLSEDEWIEAMVTYPKLMERPIVVSGKKAIIGRPPENVKNLL